MLVKLILSIDRTKSFNEAMEVLNLATSYDFFDRRSIASDPIRIIVGLDFSGNPLGGTFDDFSPLFDQAKESGLKTTIHTAETKELSENISATFEEDETSYVISFGADRLGHALHLLQYHFDTLIKLKARGHAPPIEICPTSNFFTLNLRSYADHPQFRRLFSMDYPISINTDDRGIFATSLTEELLHVKNAFSLSVVDIIEILASTVDQTFASTEEVEAIRTRFWRLLNDIANDLIDNKQVSQVIKEVAVNRAVKAKLAESNKKTATNNEVDLTMYINSF